MNESREVFHAWYEDDVAGTSHIKVNGTVVDTDGSTTTIVRAVSQGMNPHVLVLRFNVEPYPGPFHPHTAVEREISYEELSPKGALTDVKLEHEGGIIAIRVGTSPGQQ
jgi:hypothetical protein